MTTPIQNFYQQLSDAGVQKHCMWQTKSAVNSNVYDLDLWALFSGTERKLKHELMIVKKHDDGGFDVFFPTQFSDVTMIVEDILSGDEE